MSIRMRCLVYTLLTSTALSSVSLAQNVPAQQPDSGQPVQQPSRGQHDGQSTNAASAAQQGGGQQNFGTVYVIQPSVALAQSGLTASPTDYGALLQRATSQSANQGRSAGSREPNMTPGGVTRQDIGGGYMILEQATKTRSTVTRDAIDKLSPTANPYQMINLLPGVAQFSSDNTGLNGGNIRMRGFNSDHIGMTIEGMPVNDSGNYALYPQEFVDAENIGQVSIAQGTPDLDSPHVGATGGVINMYMRDPAKTAGALVDFSMGSNNLRREFVRVESGEINGVSAYVSYSNLQKDHWIGPGHDDRQHIDFKGKWDIGSGNTVRLSVMYNEAVNNFYVYPTMTQFKTQPYSQWGYLSQLPSSFSTPNAGNIDQSANSAFNYSNYRVNPFKNLIVSAPSNFTINSKLKFDTIPYYWYGYGSGGGTSTMNEGGMYWGDLKVTGVNYGGGAGLGDKILYYNPNTTETNRPGIINKFTYTAGNHEFVAGHWFEYAMHKQTQPYMPLDANGNVADVWGTSGWFTLPSSATCQKYNPTTKKYDTGVTCPTGAMQTRDQYTETMTNMFFVGDTWKATNRLTVAYGLKQVFVDRTVNNYMPGANPAEPAYHDTATLPTVGARYKLNDANTVFANFGTSFRSAPNYTLIQSFSNSNGVVTPANPLPIEEGKTFELGHRYQGSLFATALSGFYGYFDNYQQSSRIGDPAGSSSYVTSTVNVGSIQHYGLNAEIGTRPIENFRPYVSAELLRTEMLDNNLLAQTTANGNDYLRTKGRELPTSPHYQFGVGLDYDNGHWFGNLSYKYIGSQYSTFMNDESMPAYGRMDAAIGYRFADAAGFKAPEIKLNFYNILDSNNLTGVNGIYNNATATTGVNGGSIKTTAPTYYMGEGFSFMMTLRAGL